MCLSDTAEYWQDVKRNNGYFPYMGKEYYCIPNTECGNKQHNLAKALGDVNCKACLKLIADGYEHNLPEGKTDFRSKAQIKRDNKAEREKIERKKLGSCSCGCQRVKRQNKKDNTFFLGCSNYPKCKATSSIK